MLDRLVGSLVAGCDLGGTLAVVGLAMVGLGIKQKICKQGDLLGVVDGVEMVLEPAGRGRVPCNVLVETT